MVQIQPRVKENKNIANPGDERSVISRVIISFNVMFLMTITNHKASKKENMAQSKERKPTETIPEKDLVADLDSF